MGAFRASPADKEKSLVPETPGDGHKKTPVLRQQGGGTAQVNAMMRNSLPVTTETYDTAFQDALNEKEPQTFACSSYIRTGAQGETRTPTPFGATTSR